MCEKHFSQCLIGRSIKDSNKLQKGRCAFPISALYLDCKDISSIGGVEIMRIFIKILLFPISLLLTIIVSVSMFVVERCAVLLNIVSGLMFIAALACFSQYFFGWPMGTAGESSTLQLAIIGSVFAFLLSPYGLPSLAAWALGMLDNLNGAIKSI